MRNKEKHKKYYEDINNNSLKINKKEVLKVKIEEPEKLNIEETGLREFVDVAVNEYDKEMEKKQSFENRAGLILAMLGAVCVFLFQEVKIIEIINLFRLDINGISLLIIISGAGVIFGFVVALISIFRTLVIKDYRVFDISRVDTALLESDKEKALKTIFKTYEEIVAQAREKNDEKAKHFHRALLCSVITIFCLIIYISF